MLKHISFSFFFFLFGFANFTTNAQSTFRGIVPYVTTKTEVERKLGKPDRYERYELAEGTVSVLYLKTVCEKSANDCLCLAAFDTVLEVVVQPYPDMKIHDLKLDPKIWQRADVTGGHVPGLEVYMNRKTGVTYEVDMNDGVVREIRYGVTENTCKKLSEQRKSLL